MRSLHLSGAANEFSGIAGPGSLPEEDWELQRECYSLTEPFRLPARLQKKIDRLARHILRAAERKWS